MSLRKLAILGFALTLMLPMVAEAGLPLVGTSAGVFVNPVGPVGMIADGVGTNFFSWGNAIFGTPQSSLGIAGVGFSTQTETVFSFGTLTYFNGTIASGTQADAVDLLVTLMLTTPAGVNTPFSFNLQLINSPNTSDPIASADIVNFPSFYPSTVFDYDGVLHTLQIVGFGTVSGGGYTTSSSFNVLENQSASVDLLGVVTSDVSNVVPEPGSLALLGLGLSAMAGGLRRRRARK